MSSLLRTLMKPDHDDDPEKSLIATAANILQIGEFQLLQLAHHEWHGKDLEPDKLDRLFAAYMLHSEVTPWMRHYARGIVDTYERGEIDIDDPSWHRYDHVYTRQVSHGRMRFIAACLVVVLVLVGTIWFSQMQVGSGGGSVFPPYFDSQAGR